MSPLATILRPHEQLERAGSAGRAALNVETLVVDDDGTPVAPGEVGEIVHRSPHAALGYYEDDEKTAAAFAGGWFHSGDLGVMTADGYLSVVDRKKDMIKTGGENVASREIEEAVYELDGVAEVAVFGISHPHWIEAVTAVVVPKAGVTADRGRRACAHPRPARGLQAAQVRPHRGRAAEEPQRQDPQARTPGAARRPGGRRRERRLTARGSGSRRRPPHTFIDRLQSLRKTPESCRRRRTSSGCCARPVCV